MKNSLRTEERGQTLILVALTLVVLLGAVALAVDIGMALAERRQMQNAADAGALAGAQQLCWLLDEDTPTQEAAAIAAAKTYAEKNGAIQANTTVTIASWDVTVAVTETVRHSFAPVVGITSTDVPAVATARCGSTPTACGLWPIAFSLDLWNQLRANGSCDSGRYMYVWTGDDENGNQSDELEGPDCTRFDCDIDPKPHGDGIDDVFSDVGRAWVDFSDVIDPLYPDACYKAGGCGADELKCRIRDLTGGRLTLPACLAGDTGKKVGAGKAMNDMAGAVVKIPLFSSRGCGPACSGPDVIAGDSFYITELGCAIVAKKPFEKITLKAKDPKDNQKWSDWVAKVAMNCEGCSTTCGTPDGPPVVGGVNGVSLVR